MLLADGSVGLDQILIQLNEVAPQWRELAEAVGVENVDEISDYVRKALKIPCCFQSACICIYHAGGTLCVHSAACTCVGKQ